MVSIFSNILAWTRKVTAKVSAFGLPLLDFSMLFTDVMIL